MQRDMQRQEGRLTVEALRNCVDVSFIVIRAQQHGNMTCIPEKEEEGDIYIITQKRAVKGGATQID
jgi:hypothetical protein